MKEINQYYSTCQSLLLLCISWEKVEFRTRKSLLCIQLFHFFHSAGGIWTWISVITSRHAKNWVTLAFYFARDSRSEKGWEKLPIINLLPFTLVLLFGFLSLLSFFLSFFLFFFLSQIRTKAIEMDVRQSWSKESVGIKLLWKRYWKTCKSIDCPIKSKLFSNHGIGLYSRRSSSTVSHLKL